MLQPPIFVNIAYALAACSLILFFGSASLFAAEKSITVAADGSGDFKTLQEAVAAVPAMGSERVILRVRAGIYEGPVVVPTSKTLMTFKGDNAQSTIITWGRNVKDPIPVGADGTNPGVHIRGDGFRAENITFRNTSGDHGQGLAVRVDADRVVFSNCRLLGWQDTLMVNKGRQYFKDCYIEGRVDFIYGDGIAVFDQCHLHSKNGGYVTAASTPPERPFGFVFLRCKLTGDAVPWVDPAGLTPATVWKLPNAHLGRPWRPYGSVAFIECEMGDHIKPEGWSNWGKTENEATTRFAEFGNTGPGVQPEQRVAWAKRLSKEEAANITAKTVLAGKDDWNPADEPAK
ncbi:MAG: pectin esterase [Chthoniobacteraceae bacterium]|nr:pectin esterase [Chthoniobacteraceae bacterium]